MKLTHIGISHFRSIGAEPVMIDLAKKVTVLVGQNDGGKSNVLRGLERVSRMRQEKGRDPEEVDYHKRDRNEPPLAYIRVMTLPDSWQCLQAFKSLTFYSSFRAAFLDAAHSAEIESAQHGQYAALRQASGREIGFLKDSDREKVLGTICMEITQRLRETIPAFHTIPQYRRIEDTEQYSIEGKGIIKLLASWQHPDIGHDDLRKKFAQIQNLLRALLNRPNAEIEVPPKHDKIIIKDDPNRLPLESHGTGVHQLIILAIAVLSQDNVMFGIEEPEIHLHPLLQKRFLHFLLTETTNRYVISTHSPALIAPSDEVDVIHLKMVEGVTIPTRVETDRASLAVLEDLGLQPSDLLQANSVIWVEGPSDRIYLNRWIEMLYPDLVEGIDYSIMFYGGRLLAHLSMEREDSEEMNAFVKLLRINQRSALMMDSDRAKGKKELNATKLRLQAECESNGVHCWVTDGREIENYLPARVVEAALREALKDQPQRILPVKLNNPVSKFDLAMKAAIRGGSPAWCDYSKHKPEWAHRFVKHFGAVDSDLSMELKKQVDEMMRALLP